MSTASHSAGSAKIRLAGFASGDGRSGRLGCVLTSTAATAAAISQVRRVLWPDGLLSRHPRAAPPQGTSAATTDQTDPGALIRYQDLTRVPGLKPTRSIEHRLGIIRTGLRLRTRRFRFPPSGRCQNAPGLSKKERGNGERLSADACRSNVLRCSVHPNSAASTGQRPSLFTDPAAPPAARCSGRHPRRLPRCS